MWDNKDRCPAGMKDHSSTASAQLQSQLLVPPSSEEVTFITLDTGMES